ncbi:ras-like GTP-binding protein rhoA [Trichonephila clavipes]|nr:ras-like GTP-binding protein rhoA [Trichonephila clavipes]
MQRTLAYDTVRPLSYKDASVFLLCFTIGNPDTLDSTVNKWFPEIRQHSQNIPIILCGCQSDLRNDAETMCELAKVKKVPVTAEQYKSFDSYAYKRKEENRNND